MEEAEQISSSVLWRLSWKMAFSGLSQRAAPLEVRPGELGRKDERETSTRAEHLDVGLDEREVHHRQVAELRPNTCSEPPLRGERCGLGAGSDDLPHRSHAAVASGDAAQKRDDRYETGRCRPTGCPRRGGSFTEGREQLGDDSRLPVVGNQAVIDKSFSGNLAAQGTCSARSASFEHYQVARCDDWSWSRKRSLDAESHLELDGGFGHDRRLYR